MEPFNLTLSPVNSQDSAASFDSFNNVVNYETNFGPSDQSLPLSSYNVNTVEYTWTDYTFTTSAPIQTTQGGSPVRQSLSPVVPYQPVWCGLHEQGSPPHRAFLVHHDDSLEDRSDKGLYSERAVSATREQLSVLAQISSNTTAVAKSSRRHHRYVAKTTTSPSTPIPPPGTMTSQQQAAGSSLNQSMDSSDGQAEGAEDSSFETVAEALRLQWSVIGNKHLTPVDPDIVAQVVAQATGQIKAGNSVLGPPSVPTTPRASSTPISMVSTQPVTLPLPVILPLLLNIPLPAIMPLPVTISNPNLIRIIPTEISSERPKRSSPSWYSPGSQGSESARTGSPSSAPSVAAPSPSATNRTSGSHAEGQSGNSISDSNNTPPSQTEGTSISTPTQPGFHPSMGNNASSDAVSPRKMDVLDTVIEEGSVSHDAEMAKYLDSTLAAAGLSSNYQLESEEFLKSLPPIKPINLDAYTAAPLLPPAPVRAVERNRKPPAKSSATEQKKDSPAKSVPVEAVKKTVMSLQTSAPIPSPTVDSVQHSGDNSVDSRPNKVKVATNSGSDPNAAAIAVYKKQVEDILKEKAKLMGQVEILTEESQNVLQERAELQAQLASLKSRLSSVDEGGDRASQAGLRKEVNDLRDSRQLLERTVMDANRMLGQKAEEVRALQDELQLAQDAANKLQVKTQEMRDEIHTRDMNVQALKNKIAELYVEVQTSIQAKMEADTEARTARNDLASLVKAKEWYQEQLQAAHDVRAKLQRELTLLQGQGISHGAIVERLKTESARLRQQLSESQQRALRDKEALAKHLERIQGDMMEREAAFLEIQRERKLYEDTFNSQVSTVEEEKSRLAGLQQATSDLEAQLQRAQGEATRHHEQLMAMESGQMDVMKRLALAEKTLGEREKTLEDMEQKLIQASLEPDEWQRCIVESQLAAVMADLTKKDAEIMSLKEEKAATEIALKSALLEKSSVDKALDILKADMGKVEQSFKQMKHELSVRTVELEQTKLEREKLQESLDCSQHELEIKARSMDAMTRTFEGQTSAQHDMANQRDVMQGELDTLRIKVRWLEHQSARVRDLEAKLEAVDDNALAEKVALYEAGMESLRGEIAALEAARASGDLDRESERREMSDQLDRLKAELTERQKNYEENLDSMDSKMKELLSDREQLQTELGLAQRSQELSQLEEREAYTQEIQSLSRELSSARQDKSDLERRLESVQREKSDEISELVHRLADQTEELKQLESQHAALQRAEATNQDLALELEKERGRVMGLSQTSAELKEHSHQLEAALAQRETALDELRRSVEDSNSDLQHRDEAFLQRIAELEAAVDKEVGVQKDLRKQMGSKIMENKRLKKQCDSSGSELEQLRKDLEHSKQAATSAIADLEQLQQLHRQVKGQDEEEVQRRRELEAQVEAVTARLEESLAKEPLLLEQIQSLEWQYGQVSRELEAAREQFRQVQDRAQEETQAAKASLQAAQCEIDDLQAELAALRQEKMHQRSQVNELRGTLQASMQHHKLTKRLNSAELTDVGVQADAGRKVVIPPLPFDLAAVEQLLRDTRIKPLESRPLEQLSDCLSSLRAEITGLQKQMDQHTSAVNSSRDSIRQTTVQSGVNDLNEVMRTIANTIIAANSTNTLTIAAAADREQTAIFDV
ncbi:hypothetical protein EGW08_016362 [Elysia chlorotica]|uniref:Uncharacterized protein n=1 Tax=Elysia chlorotica TaxID=188477 RepID=A0A433T2T8_ELYCH|nr:hypothetical protein EGW08_016362 [Elysia chlorotica]